MRGREWSKYTCIIPSEFWYLSILSMTLCFALESTWSTIVRPSEVVSRSFLFQNTKCHKEVRFGIQFKTYGKTSVVRTPPFWKKLNSSGYLTYSTSDLVFLISDNQGIKNIEIVTCRLWLRGLEVGRSSRRK